MVPAFWWTTAASRDTSRSRSERDILSSMLRSTETTHEVRLATSGRPMSSTISPRWGCMTTSRTDWEAAWAWYSSPPTTWR